MNVTTDLISTIGDQLDGFTYLVACHCCYIYYDFVCYFFILWQINSLCLVRHISKIKCLPLLQEPPVWTDFLRLEAKDITFSKNNISINIFFGFLSVMVSKNYVTNAITLCSVCRIASDTVEMVIMPNLAVIDNNPVIWRFFRFVKILIFKI